MSDRGERGLPIRNVNENHDGDLVCGELAAIPDWRAGGVWLGAAAGLLPFVTVKVFIGMVVVLVLLFCLLGLRLTIRLTRHKARPSLARLAEFEEQEAPEWDPRVPIERTAARPVPRTPRQVQSTQPDLNPIFEELSATAKIRYSPLPEDAELAEGEFNYTKAAKLWSRLGRWREAARCHEKSGDIFQAAQIYLALEMNETAFPLLKEALANSPADEQIRLRLVETLFDLHQPDKAMEVIGAVKDPNSPIQPTAEFLARVGRRLEAAHLLTEAENFYREALALDDSQPDVEARVQFLKQLRRLSSGTSNTNGDTSPAKELLDRYTSDSSDDGVPTKNAADEKAESGAASELSGHEVIVGHLALGFQKPEPLYSVRSKFSISRRFMFENLLNQTERCTVFMARDKLLDSPVALKLYRLPSDFTELERLRERLLAVAQLNHPNLAKVTFVDREGRIVRVATEFLPGGNLTEYLNKLGGVGLPLILRMALHISSALHTAHMRGVPHGDLRPENLIIGTDQRIKLVDFALSPTPVRVADDPDLDIGDSSSATSSTFRANAAATEAVLADIVQFSEVLDFMLENSRQSADPTQSDSIGDAIREIRELNEKVREGAFSSILSLWQILHEIFERSLPASSRSDHKKR